MGGMRCPECLRADLVGRGARDQRAQVVRRGVGLGAEAAGCSASTSLQMLFLTLCVRSTQHGARESAPLQDLTPGQMGGGGASEGAKSAA